MVNRPPPKHPPGQSLAIHEVAIKHPMFFRIVIAGVAARCQQAGRLAPTAAGYAAATAAAQAIDVVLARQQARR